MRNRLAGWVAACAVALAAWHPAHAAEAVAAPAHEAPQPALDLALRIVRSGDNANMPFAVVDKHAAMVMVYRADGTLAGASTALLGLTPGDDSLPGVGYRTQTGQLRIADRTTPAGRFESLPGRNTSGEKVVWLDYDKAFAIHRLRPAPAVEKRVQRMASANPRDKRISAGCVVVPEAFFDGVIQPTLGQGKAVVYVMPEHSSWQQMWATLAQRAL